MPNSAPVRKNVVRRGFGSCLTLAFLAGCSGLPVAPARPPDSVPSGASAADRGAASWMRAGAGTKDLLYVAGAAVDVYAYPQGKLVGELTGLSYPLGQCTDERGDVYITDHLKGTIVEYAHGGTQPIRTLSVPGSGPFACAVDPVRGDLAVTASGSTSGMGSDLAIYRRAAGKPKTYTDAHIMNFAYCAYDRAGDLFVDGIPANSDNFLLAELPRGGTSLQSVTLQGGISWMAALQWNGKYLAVGQPIRPAILRYTIAAGYGTYAGSTSLNDAYDALQFVIADGHAIVTNEHFRQYAFEWDVLVFDYPQGGYETEDIENSSTGISSVALSRRR